ncbi:MAG: 2-phospho-L-lactate transferase [Alphaproteobacteria bacterium]|nr:2-phospho-L-lactate transferase [Alphaproteobacteria bacterium]
MSGHVLALSGGVGGAKLAAGLCAVLPPESLTIAVNTGDDFEYLDLTICPDLDSVTYALAGLNDTARGWGVADETWQAMAMISRLGGPNWFNLGDRDLGLHLTRAMGLREGMSLSEVTARLIDRLGIAHRVVPMSDDPVRTRVRTDAGWLDFQHYFVREQCRPEVRGVRFAGADEARPSPGLVEALARPDFAAVVICPSNPWLSIDPILALPGVRDRIAELTVPVIAVSPLVGGTALKGPLAKLMGELGQPVTNLALAEHYDGLLDHLVIDEADAADAKPLHDFGLCATVTQTVMREGADRERLAREVLVLVDGVE